MEKNMETIIFEIITYSGEAKAYAYEALNAAEEGNYDKIDDYLKQSDENLLEAHKIQTSLIQKEASGEKVELTMLFVHAQDQLMSAMESRTLIENLIKLNKKIDGIK